MNGWEEVKLSQICDVRDGTHDSPKQKDNGKPLITSRHIKQGSIDFTSSYNISLEDFDAINKRSKVDKYDILFSMIGTIAETALIDFEPDFAIKNVGLIKTKGDINLANWVYYYLKSKDAKAEIDACLKGSTQQYVTLGDLRNFPIKYPPLPEQKAIAKVLTSLDDKIDLLHRQNKTLEAMAETLFRQWFVEETEGEDTSPLSDYAKNIRHSINKEKLQEHENYVGLEHIPKKNLALTSWGNTTDLASNKSEFKQDDILFGKLRSYFHKVVFAPVDGVCSTDILVIRPKKDEYFPFCLFWFSSKEVVEYSDMGSEGTRMPRTNWKIISSYEVPTPDKNRVIEFDSIVRPILKKITTNSNHIAVIKRTRDQLLPKLMSGEVKVEV